MIFRWLMRSIPCRHTFAETDDRVVGVTLNWAGKPTKLWRTTHTCSKCGHVKTSDMIYTPALAKSLDQPVSSDGWPLDEQGARLPIYIPGA